MRRLALLLLAATFLLAPLADAQRASSTLSLSVHAPTAPLVPGNQTVVDGLAKFTGDATTYLALGGVPVSYKVTKAPAWTTVNLMPASDVFPSPSTPGVSFTSTRQFSVTVLASTANATEESGIVEITALTQSSGLDGGAAAKVSFLVTRAPAEATHTGCQDATTSVSSAPAPTSQPARSDTVTVQTAAATPVSPTLVLVGFGAAGAGVGLLVRRRLR